jgi:hypothetical protein
MTADRGPSESQSTRHRVATAAAGVGGIVLIAAALYIAFWQPRTPLSVALTLALAAGGLLLAGFVFEAGRARLEARVGKRGIALAGAGIALLITLMGLVGTRASDSSPRHVPHAASRTFAATLTGPHQTAALRQFLRTHDGKTAFIDLRLPATTYSRLVTETPSTIQVDVPASCERNCQPGNPGFPATDLFLTINRSPSLVYDSGFGGQYRIRGYVSVLYSGSHTGTDAYLLNPTAH